MTNGSFLWLTSEICKVTLSYFLFYFLVWFHVSTVNYRRNKFGVFFVERDIKNQLLIGTLRLFLFLNTINFQKLFMTLNIHVCPAVLRIIFSVLTDFYIYSRRKKYRTGFCHCFHSICRTRRVIKKIIWYCVTYPQRYIIVKFDDSTITKSVVRICTLLQINLRTC